jgi:phenylacetate-CoA ligase
VERTPDAPGDGAARAKLAADVQHRLKLMIGLPCAVLVRAPGGVPRSQGKAVRVRDERVKTRM